MKKIETSLKTWKGEVAWLRSRATELETLAEKISGDYGEDEILRQIRLLRERADYLEHPRREVVT